MNSTLLLFCAYFPVVLLIWLMAKKHGLAACYALPLSAAVVYMLCMLVFPFAPILVHANVILGVLLAATPILIIASAILLFKVLDKTGAMLVIKSHLNQVSTNAVAQLVIVGWAFAFLIEGASGFGTPAALAAPILIGLGFEPLRVAVLVLAMNSVPVSFGAVGTPTWFGFSPLGLSETERLAIGKLSAIIHMVCSFIIPLLALSVLLSWRVIKANLLYIWLCISATMVPFLVVSFYSYEFPSLIGGACGLFASIVLAKKGVGLSSSVGSSNAPTAVSANHTSNVHTMSLVKATFPLWGTIAVLVLTRLPSLPFKAWLTSAEPAISMSIEHLGYFSLSAYGALQWQSILHTGIDWRLNLLYIPALLPFWLVSMIMLLVCKSRLQLAKEVMFSTLLQMRKPIFALIGALVFVSLMMMGGAHSPVYLIGIHLADTFGGAWLFFAPFLGALGAFFSGSATISNLTFGAIQTEVAARVDLPQQLVLALQSVGAALGNMVCINNIVAVASVLGLQKAEGPILRKTIVPMMVYAVLAGSTGTLYWFLFMA
ncbi:lactate permease LctP family transporter [Alteromonas sp. D210916BOD_24]|uniref:L-lactate permease n=1 Tax=Alteromonas sp. D210916BOD_24 TaxID=3157618 RepID=UPI00399C54B1